MTDQPPTPEDKISKYKELADFLITRIGLPAVILGAVLWFHFHEFSEYRKEMAWKLERVVRNTRSIMSKLGIPVALEGDQQK